jgi:HKD family nuclease
MKFAVGAFVQKPGAADHFEPLLEALPKRIEIRTITDLEAVVVSP